MRGPRTGVVKRPAFADDERRACLGQDTEIFYSERAVDQDRARALCAGCPVRRACDDWATGREKHGIWAGRNRERDRRPEPRPSAFDRQVAEYLREMNAYLGGAA